MKLFVEYSRAPHLNQVVDIPEDIARSLTAAGQDRVFVKGVQSVLQQLDDEPVIVTIVE